MTVPEALMNKWKKVFLHRDTDNDGMVTEDDYKRYAEHFITVYGERAEPVRKVCMLLWEACTPKGYKSSMTETEFLDNCTYIWNTDRQTYKDTVEKYCLVIFDAIDSNGDGVISLEEYSVYQNCFGIHNRDYIEHIFEQLDANQDGVISREELVGEIMDYMFEDAPPKIPDLYDHEQAKNFKKK